MLCSGGHDVLSCFVRSWLATLVLLGGCRTRDFHARRDEHLASTTALRPNRYRLVELPESERVADRGFVIYFDERERLDYLVFILGSELRFMDGTLLDGKYNFVMSPQGEIFASSKVWALDAQGIYRRLHHSSFLAGAPVAAAGTLLVEKGQIIKCDNHSGHYKPDGKLNEQFLRRLRDMRYDFAPEECEDVRWQDEKHEGERR